MRTFLILTATLLVAACSRSNEEQLREAANQSDPAAAQVLNDAAEAGVPPQEALQRAGNAAAQTKTEGGPPSGSVQARPNLPGHPNPEQPGRPPDRTVTKGQ
jgi:Tfp pilus assembly protein PilX